MRLFLLPILLTALTLSGCLTVRQQDLVVRQQDLDAWAGMPVEALETHSFFITVPVFKTKTKSGIEVWNYANSSGSYKSCYASAGAFGDDGYVSAAGYESCTTNKTICNNIFYIKDGIVLEYAPTGKCYTAAFVQPEARYRRFTGNSR